MIEKIQEATPPRLYGWAIFTALLMLVIWYLAPHQIPVVLYKISLVTLGIVLAYWLDRALFPKMRPHALVGWFAVIAGIRRAIIVLACVLGLTLGL